MNLGEIKSECGRLLNDPNNDRWNGDILTDRANNAQNEIQALTNAVKTLELLTPTLNSNNVSINANTIDIAFANIVDSNGHVEPFEGKTREELNYRYPDYLNWGAGQPKVWYLESSTPQIKIFPAPSSQYVITDSIQLWEIRKPQAMDSDDDIPFDSSVGMIPFHMALVHHIVSYCWMDDATPESLGKSTYHRSGNIDKPGQFELQIKLIKAKFDNPTEQNNAILIRPQGGRIGRWLKPSKSYPFSF